MAPVVAASLFTQSDDFQGGNQGLFFLKLLDAFNDHAGITVLCDEKGLFCYGQVFTNLCWTLAHTISCIFKPCPSKKSHLK